VQGVGFRFTVERIASRLKLTGWVRNMPDGGVELIAEGDADSLRVLLENIKENMSGYITRDVVHWQEYKGEYRDFDIKF
jgi:acylphosphatase